MVLGCGGGGVPQGAGTRRYDHTADSNCKSRACDDVAESGVNGETRRLTLAIINFPAFYSDLPGGREYATVASSILEGSGARDSRPWQTALGMAPEEGL